MNSLTAVIITLNEESNIARCIDSLRGVADHILLLDSYSNDNTVQIAERKGATVFYEKFNGYTEQKQRVVALSKTDYVFSIDADEVVSDELRKSIEKVKRKGFAADAYEMNRLNFIGDVSIKTGGLYPDTKIRIWNKTKGGWQGGKVHEQLCMNPGSVIGKLGGDLLHYSYKTKEDMIKQMEHFANLSAIDLKEEGLLFLYLKLVLSPAFKFIRNYIFKRGFADGRLGYAVCYQQSRGVYFKYCKAIQLKQQ